MSKHTPGPLSVELRLSGQHGNQYAIENDTTNVDGEWNDIYVHFSGYFGSYGPHVFAAAPDLLEALTFFVTHPGVSQLCTPNSDVMTAARAAIQKATQ